MFSGSSKLDYWALDPYLSKKLFESIMHETISFHHKFEFFSITEKKLNRCPKAYFHPHVWSEVPLKQIILLQLLWITSDLVVFY